MTHEWVTYASRAGHVHGLGQAFRMALHALGVLHELPGLTLQEVALLHALPVTADIPAGHAVLWLWAPAALWRAERVTDVARGL